MAWIIQGLQAPKPCYNFRNLIFLIFPIWHLCNTGFYYSHFKYLFISSRFNSVSTVKANFKWKLGSVMSDSLQPHGLQPTRLLRPQDFPGKSTGVGCHFLLQMIFPTQGSNPGLSHCRQMLDHLSHQESPGSLARPCYIVIWTNTSLDVAVKVFSR